MSRPTRNSRDAGLLPEVAPAGLPDVSLQSSHPATSVNSAVTSVASSLTAAQLSPDCLAAIVQAVRASIAAEGPHVSLSQLSSSPASVAVAGASCSSLPVPGGVPGLDLGAQASALLASGTGFSQPPSLASTSCSQGRPAFVVPSFISTFAPPNPSLASSRASSVAAFPPQSGVPTSFAANPAPILHQPFVVGPGFSPIPEKIVTQIVSGKFVEFDELLSSNIVLTEPEPQLLFDGRLVLTSGPKKLKRRIEDIATWMEAFSTFMLVLSSYFPHRWKDLCQYQLLILQTHRQFASRVWLSYDRAFRQHAAATNLVDWSSINVQLFNFHAAGSSVRGRNDVPSGSSEPSGSSTSRIVCRSWNRGQCSAPGAACRFAHRCSRCSGVHRASSCPGLSSDKSQADSKRRESSPESGRSRSKSRRV